MKTIDLNTTWIDLDQLLKEIQEGTEILLVRGKTPLARVVPVEADHSKRTPGLHKDGIFWVSDDFDEPLPDEFWLGEE